ncbi:hypothetical protein BDV59DRAFT_188975 [Aspergillus ambiguus]|uniref:uncharacterized protein n=1 Tax=Aspergillus ambiguus TaxID=176160 RepID=UPI003CCD942C
MSYGSGRSGFCSYPLCGHPNSIHKYEACREPGCRVQWKKCTVPGDCNGLYYRICKRCTATKLSGNLTWEGLGDNDKL